MEINIVPERRKLFCLEFVDSPFRLNLFYKKYVLVVSLFGEPELITFEGRVYDTVEKEALNFTDKEHNVHKITKSYLQIYDKKESKYIYCYPHGNNLAYLRLYFKK